MNPVELSKIVSTIFAGLSVLVAIYVYRANSERQYFANLRKSISRYRELVDESEELFDEIGLVEVGHSVGVHLREVCPQGCSTNEIQKFFYDEENADFIRQGIFLGLGTSSTLNRAKALSLEMVRVSGEFSEPFPVFRACLGIMSAYNSAIVNTVSSGHLVDSIFQMVREKKDIFEPQPESELLYPDLVFRQMSIYVTVLHTEFINNHAAAMLEQVETITGLITRHYAAASDRELRKLSRREHKEISLLHQKADAVGDSEKSLFEYLKFLKPVLQHDDWDKIVESKTLLEAVSPVSSGEE